MKSSPASKTPRLLLGLLLTALSTQASAAIHCVTSPAQIQNALNLSGSDPGDDEIRLVAGTYVLSQSLFFTTGNAQSISISGGWGPGCAAVPSDDARSVLSGNSATSVFGANVAVIANFAFDRLTVVDGRRGLPGGAGFFVRTFGDVTVDRSEFLRNSTTVNAARGGAIYIQYARGIVIDRSRFEDNEAGTGGGIYVSGCAAPARVARSTFRGNGNLPLQNGIFSGSAIFVANSAEGQTPLSCPSISIEAVSFEGQREAPLSLFATGPIDLTAVSITGTLATSGEGSEFLACGRITSASLGSIGDIRISNSMFEGSNVPSMSCLNLNTNSSGSIAISGSRFFNFSARVFERFGLVSSNRCVIKRSVFEANSGGPVMSPICDNLEIRDSRFLNNRATGAGPAAVELGFGTNRVVLESNIFRGNVSEGSGSAVQANLFCKNQPCGVNTSAEIRVTNNTFVSNAAQANGGAVIIRSAFDALPSIYFANNLFWMNTTSGNGRDLFFDNDYDGNFVATPATFEFNALGLSSGGYASTLPVAPPAVPTNFDAINPRFFDLAAGDVRLTTASPYVEVGLDSALGLDGDDVAGGARIVNRIDLGAFELSTVLFPELIFSNGFEE